MTAQPEPACGGRGRRGRKYEQVIAGAREVFLQEGYEGASVDVIARVAGVSKATLYSYFPDKRHLFVEVATRECRRQARVAIETIDTARPPAEVLFEAAERLMGFVLSDLGCAVFRIVVAEAERFPELGREYWESGPGQVRRILGSYLAEAVARGELAICDIPMAADQFAELCKADLFTRRLMGVADPPGPEARARVARAAVETFLARYAPPPDAARG